MKRPTVRYQRFMTEVRWKARTFRLTRIDRIKIGATNYWRPRGAYWFVVRYKGESFHERRFKWQFQRRTFRSRLWKWRQK